MKIKVLFPNEILERELQLEKLSQSFKHLTITKFPHLYGTIWVKKKNLIKLWKFGAGGKNKEKERTVHVRLETSLISPSVKKEKLNVRIEKLHIRCHKKLVPE